MPTARVAVQIARSNTAGIRKLILTGTQKVTRRHQTPTWQDPPRAGIRKLILTGTHRTALAMDAGRTQINRYAERYLAERLSLKRT
jgi:hypothetical protein